MLKKCALLTYTLLPIQYVSLQFEMDLLGTPRLVNGDELHSICLSGGQLVQYISMLEVSILQ